MALNISAHRRRRRDALWDEVDAPGKLQGRLGSVELLVLIHMENSGLGGRLENQ